MNEEMRTIEAIAPPTPPPSSTKTAAAEGFCPWRRFFARRMDQGICQLLIYAWIGLGAGKNLLLLGQLAHFFVGYAAFVLLVFLEPLCLVLFASTPGKAIFRLRVEALGGGKLSYGTALQRAGSAICYGMGLGIPLVELVCLWKSYKRCSRGEVQPWDVGCVYRAKPALGFAVLPILAAYTAFLLLIYALVGAQQLAPNRGSLTLADFAENYRYYAAYFEMDSDGWRLGDDGKWEKKPPEHNAYAGTATVVSFGPEQPPAPLAFVSEGGVLQSVSTSIEYEGGERLVLLNHEEQSLLLALSLVGAQKELGPLSFPVQRLISLLPDGTKTQDRLEIGGVSILYERDDTDYQLADRGLLFAKEEGEQLRHFRVFVQASLDSWRA